uniref:Uncharacterized protein n=1 Tax=Anguilla anguilla TaxID=7936 RepID=A0A0E9T9F6_ANGAN
MDAFIFAVSRMMSLLTGSDAHSPRKISAW